jgi:hypothetical protein
MMDPYFSHIQTDTTPHQSSYPTVTAYLDQQDECCSSLDFSTSAIDEERAVLPRAGASLDGHASCSQSVSSPGSFVTLSRRVMDSPPLKQCVFFSCVFLLFSGVGLAAVGSGLFLTRSHVGAGSSVGGRSYFHGAGGLEVNGVEKALMTDEELIGTCFMMRA